MSDDQSLPVTPISMGAAALRGMDYYVRDLSAGFEGGDRKLEIPGFEDTSREISSASTPTTGHSSGRKFALSGDTRWEASDHNRREIITDKYDKYDKQVSKGLDILFCDTQEHLSRQAASEPESNEDRSSVIFPESFEYTKDELLNRVSHNLYNCVAEHTAALMSSNLEKARNSQLVRFGRVTSTQKAVNVSGCLHNFTRMHVLNRVQPFIAHSDYKPLEKRRKFPTVFSSRYRRERKNQISTNKGLEHEFDESQFSGNIRTNFDKNSISMMLTTSAYGDDDKDEAESVITFNDDKSVDWTIGGERIQYMDKNGVNAWHRRAAREKAECRGSA